MRSGEGEGWGLRRCGGEWGGRGGSAPQRLLPLQHFGAAARNPHAPLPWPYSALACQWRTSVSESALVNKCAAEQVLPLFCPVSQPQQPTCNPISSMLFIRAATFSGSADHVGKQVGR